METVHSGAASEQFRVLNVLNMFENGDFGPTDMSPTKMRVLPLMCRTVLKIRELNRKLLDQFEEKQERIEALERKVNFLSNVGTLPRCHNCIDAECDSCAPDPTT